MAGRIRHYIREYQDNQDTVDQPLSYTYNAQTHSTIGMTLLNVARTRKLPPASGMSLLFSILSTQKQSLRSQELCATHFDVISMLLEKLPKAPLKAQRR